MACGIESVWNNRFLRPPPVISLPAPLMQQGMKYSFMISQTSMHKRLTYLYFVNSWKILHNAIGQQLKTISQSVMSMSVMTGYHLLGIFLSTSCIERQTFGMQEQYILFYRKSASYLYMQDNHIYMQVTKSFSFLFFKNLTLICEHLLPSVSIRQHYYVDMLLQLIYVSMQVNSVLTCNLNINM